MPIGRICRGGPRRGAWSGGGGQSEYSIILSGLGGTGPTFEGGGTCHPAPLPGSAPDRSIYRYGCVCVCVYNQARSQDFPGGGEVDVKPIKGGGSHLGKMWTFVLYPLESSDTPDPPPRLRA